MRWFNLRRFLVSIFLLPVFICILLLNRICMLLDYVFFPGFRSLRIEKSIFIISAPRSATTYLFHKLSSQHDKITSFKLWELVFAPSILQKYLFLGFAKIDNFIGKPIQRAVISLERILFSDFRNIHQIGLNMPEEDEAILLWNLTTAYLHFYFPDTNYFDDYFLFDDRIKSVLQKKIMKFYYRCVQRHCFVFNRNNEKYYLSKNPAMMSKIKSLQNFFPDAVILNINRNPASTIPSTIALNNNIYRLFTSRKASAEINERTKSILIEWYKMAHKNLKTYYSQNLVEIDYNKLITDDDETINTICQKLNIKKSEFINSIDEAKSEKEHKSLNKYSAFSASELKEILEEVPFLTKYCLNKP